VLTSLHLSFQPVAHTYLCTVVRSVLDNLLNVQVDRLPKKSLASIIAVDAQILSQAQAAEVMLGYDNN
jgi:hypothetical protein